MNFLSFSLQASNELTDDSVLLTFEDNLVDRKFSPFSKTNLRLSRQSKIELSPLRTISSSHYQRLIEVRSSTRSLDRCILLSSRNLVRISMIIIHWKSSTNDKPCRIMWWHRYRWLVFSFDLPTERELFVRLVVFGCSSTISLQHYVVHQWEWIYCR